MDLRHHSYGHHPNGPLVLFTSESLPDLVALIPMLTENSASWQPNSARFNLVSNTSITQVESTSNFSPESLPRKVVLFQQLCRSEVFNPDLCEKVEFESEQILAFSNLL